MAGIMAASPRERMASLLESVELATDIPSRFAQLRNLKEELTHSDTILLSEFLSGVLNLNADQFSPVRKFVTEMIGEIGSRHLEFLPEIVPILMTVVEDDTPAVARQALASGTNIFRFTLEKVAIQGLHTSELDDALESAWAWMVKLKEQIYSLAFQFGIDGRKLLALKFVEAIILMYTPDPNGIAEPPQVVEGMLMEFNISWIRRGHPLLKIGDLSIEASQSLGLLLDQLRFPVVKSQSMSTIIVLINCLSTIARKRPSFYGRILPVLLSLDLSNFAVITAHVRAMHLALKNAFVSCLQCTHPSATPWRDRLIGALKEMKVGGLAELAPEEVCKINGSVKLEKDGSSSIEDGDTSMAVCHPLHDNVGRKRSGDQEFCGRSENNDATGKRSRLMPIVSEGSEKVLNPDLSVAAVAISSTEQAISHGETDSGPVQQLVALFGALVAQGEKAAGSLEILTASISADLLAEVVIANMIHLPSSCPKAEGDEDLPTNIGVHHDVFDSDTPFGKLSSFITNALSSSTSSQMAISMDVQLEDIDDIEIHQRHQGEKEHHALGGPDNDVLCITTTEGTEGAVPSSAIPAFGTDRLSEVSGGHLAPKLEFQDVENDNVIPGLDSTPSGGLSDMTISSSWPFTEVDDVIRDENFKKRSQLDSLPSTSTDRSEELSPKAVVTDSYSVITSTETSVGSIQQFVLPKMSVISCKKAFMHIIEAYKQVAAAGGSELQISLLAYLGVEFPLDLDPWTLIQMHLFSDFVNHEGHELTLRVLYRLYGVAEEDQDFFSSTTATSVYDMFLLKVAETLLDSFPASDKSLSRLLGEIPRLPKSIFRLLECLCSPENSVKDEKEFTFGDRVTQGLSAIWSLILLRPTVRDALLKIALQSAVHPLEEVHMKAIRLIANKLYPLSSVGLQIEEFANEMLLSAVKVADNADSVAEKSSSQLKKNCDMALSSKEQPSANTKDDSDSSPSCTSETISSTSVSEARRCMSLYFALCTKKHSLLRQIFSIYKSSPEPVKQVVDSHMPILIRTIGSSPVLLEIVSNPPDGSEKLLMQVLHTLTDGTIPSPELIFAVKSLIRIKRMDVEILFPVLSFLPKEEVLLVFPHLVNLQADKFQVALELLLQGSTTSGPVLTPGEVLIAIHEIDPDNGGIPLKKVTDACNACFEQRQFFTQQVVAKVLNHLVEQIPLPLLFMRTVLQAIGAFPTLVDFILEILSRLMSKQIWKYPKLWVGFIKCALLTQPHSFGVLLQLPPAQLENVLTKNITLKAPLIAHANQPNVRSTLPRSILAVLGIAADSQASSQPQETLPESADGATGPELPANATEEQLNTVPRAARAFSLHVSGS
ncbi:hypothetical protein Nepgr_028356 [Nepenthes gracilis]|uniref:Symplekin n=1 Tax=Nepenthes gracilis TaxID=150966 RepID=A0AAD3TC70_NEPGR|nr:hypothetical protein Nepgr_028356 [Nepenthes gracilis]